MDLLIERVCEMELESSLGLRSVDKDFDREINRITKKYLAGVSENVREEMRNELYGSLIPVKKALFLSGYQTAVRLILEGMLWEQGERR